MMDCFQMERVLVLAIALLCRVGYAEDASRENLWSGSKPFPAVNDIQLINQTIVKYHRVHTSEKPITFSIGAALVHFNGVWRSSWAANPDGVSENQGTEFVIERTSKDNGTTWSEERILAPQLDGGAFHSHGSYLIHNEKLYFFAKLGPFTGPTKVFELGTDGKSWSDRGLATANGVAFWPMDSPQQLNNGQWIMGGLGGKNGHYPAVAIASDDNILKWEVKRLPVRKFNGYGETTVITKGDEVLALSRNGALKSPMVNMSSDAGKTWQALGAAGIPMVHAKPYAGRLSNGRPYLICNIPPARKAAKRSRLCLLLGPPQGMTLDQVWLLRPGNPPAARFNGPQHNPQWAYPYAHESNGALYIVHHSAKEDIEMIVVPMNALK
jgi:hypothetical protein